MMFERGGDHFHQFISSSTTITSSSQAHQNPFDNIYPPPCPTTNLDHHPWCNNELLSLFRITSSLDNWFPNFTWELVSRKLGELGFKRSAENCKEKFEKESNSYFSNNSITCRDRTSNYKPFSEFQESLLFANNNGKTQQLCNEKKRNMEEEYLMKQDSQPPCVHHEEEENGQTTQEHVQKCKKKRRPSSTSITRKRKKRFEMFKSLCEDIVNKMMSQQEDMLNKLLQDMSRGDEEKLVKEVAWKKQEMAWINKELAFRAHHQAISSERHASLTHYLKLFTTSSHHKLPLKSSISQNTNPSDDLNAQKHNHVESSSSSHENPNSTDVGKEEIGKRWPRDEVMALLNMRCNYLNNNEQQDKEGALMKAPLWQRISQGMVELGYKRSSKRCKEKWENINKYFRKTKDICKKRSVDSRTCPYFHQLTTFYNKGRIIISQGLEDESDKHHDSLLNPNQDIFD